MGQVTVIYLTDDQMQNLWFELGCLPANWDGASDIALASVDHIVFRKAGTIE